MKYLNVKFAIAWNIMWALSYLFVALIAPGVGGGSTFGNIITYLLFGALMLATTLIIGFYPGEKNKLVARYVLAVLAVLSVFSGISSFTGVQLWVVPFANKEIFQVSMAFADLLGAAFMLYLALNKE